MICKTFQHCVKLKLKIYLKNKRKSQSQKVKADKHKRNEEQAPKKTANSVTRSLETAETNVINYRVDYTINDDQML